jgi:uroporphyrinogen-III synthase
MATPSFQGRRVLALESRRATEIAALVSKLGGQCLLAPALREVPLESNTDALHSADALIRGEFDVVVFLTGVGARALLATVEQAYAREAFLAALARTRVVVRGPKPLAVMREWQVPVWVAAPEPNTWRELVAALDARADEQPLDGARIAVQEYGVSNTELLEALHARGASVTRVPVYRWALPEDIEPLKAGALALARGEVDVLVLTSGVQLVHLWQIVEEMHLENAVRRALERAVIASIGPTTSEELKRRGFEADIEASHPKMGILVTEAAAQAAHLLQAKRRETTP